MLCSQFLRAACFQIFHNSIFNFCSNDNTINFDALSDNIKNIESIDLNQGNQEITLDLNDVMDMTDANNILQIEGDSGDEVKIDTAKWDRSVDVDNNGFREYTSNEDPTVTLKIDDDIKVDGY